MRTVASLRLCRSRGSMIFPSAAATRIRGPSCIDLPNRYHGEGTSPRYRSHAILAWERARQRRVPVTAPGADPTAGSWQSPGGTDVLQRLAMNRTCFPVPSHSRSAGWSRKAVLKATVSKLGFLPLVSEAALSTTIPPELNCLPLLPCTLLRATSVWVAPSSKIPPPWVFPGVSPLFGQNLLFLNTLLSRMVALPAPPGCPSSRTRMP